MNDTQRNTFNLNIACENISFWLQLPKYRYLESGQLVPFRFMTQTTQIPRLAFQFWLVPNKHSQSQHRDRIGWRDLLLCLLCLERLKVMEMGDISDLAHCKHIHYTVYNRGYFVCCARDQSGIMHAR